MEFMLVEITQRNNEEVLTASSRQVADKFEKEHRHVLESIDKMKEQLSTAEFSSIHGR